MEDLSRETAAALLAWYREMGVDAVVADEPVDWLERGGAVPGEDVRVALAAGARPRAEPSTPAHPTGASAGKRAAPTIPQRTTATAAPEHRSPIAPQAAPPRVFTPRAPDAAETAARTAAKAAGTVEDLAAAIAAFDGCGLKATATRACVYRGAARARLMIVGEAPGRDEDLEGKPFVGRAGQLLDKMLAAIGLDETQVHITNIVYWRPPGNRTPTPHEAQVCRPFLERQIELVQPDILMPLGGPAAKHLLDVADGIMKVRGKWRETEIAGRRIKTLASLHPAYLLRTPAAKRLAWQDLLAIKAALASG